MKKKLVTAVVGLFLGMSSIAFASNPKSVNVIKFGDANTLFVGDSKSATLYAYQISKKYQQGPPRAYNLDNFGTKLAQFAGVKLTDILIRDMAINPKSKEAFIAFDTKTRRGYKSRVVIVDQNGKIRNFDLVKIKHTEKKIQDAPTDNTVIWDKVPMRSLTFTDIDLYKGKVYISGMSNAEFSSALRVVDYPFNSKKVETTSIEIFHAVHGQMETRAPIQTLSFVTLDKEDYAIAAYTCTPLVLIPVKSLKNGAHVVGKTIAELGYGNTPVDLIQFQSQGMDKKPYQGLVLSNKNRSAQFINLKDVLASSKKESIGYKGLEKGGTPATDLPMTGLIQMDDQDPYHVASIRRNQDTGDLELHSFLKNMYLRLNEFVSEYDMPSYEYEGKQLQTKQGHNMMIKDLELPKFAKK